MEHRKIEFAFCSSFCTYSQTMEVLERIQSRYGDVLPIVSEAGAAADARLGMAHDFMREIERIYSRRMMDSIAKTEPIGPRHPLDVLVICPCTDSILTKLANGAADTAVAMAARVHLRNGGSVMLCPAINDGLAASVRNVDVLLGKKNVYFVLFRQDNPARKPTSPVADFPLISATIDVALEGRQLQPVLPEPQEADQKTHRP